jgi:hypothetical protein
MRYRATATLKLVAQIDLLRPDEMERERRRDGGLDWIGWHGMGCVGVSRWLYGA